MRGKALLILIIILVSAPLGAADFTDYYGSASSVFNDPHTGLTVFPLLKIPLGGRSLSMGTASTAVALDSGAMIENPAATALLPRTELAVSHNNWLADSSVDSAVYTRRFDNLGIGISGQFLHLPFTAYNSWGESTGAARIPEGVIGVNASYNFLSSYYFRGISVGATLKGAFRIVPEAIYPGQSLLTGMIDLGAITQFNFLKFYNSRDKNFFVGLRVKNLGLAAKGDPLPTMASAGFSYSPIRPLKLAFDFNLPFSLYSDKKSEKWYMAGGVDLTVTDFFSLQSGFNFGGANPRLSMGSALTLEDMSILVNYTLDLTTQVNTVDRFSLEAKMNLGDEGRASVQLEVDQYFLSGLEAYALGELETAVKYWDAALALDPTFQPAQEYMGIALETLSLYSRMEDMNRLR